MMGAPAGTTPPSVLMRICLTTPRTGDTNVVRRSASSRTTICSSIIDSSVRTRTISLLLSCRKRLMRSCVCRFSSLAWRRTRITSTSLIKPLLDRLSAMASSRDNNAMLRWLVDTASPSARWRASKLSVSACTISSGRSSGKAGGLPAASACSRASVPRKAWRLAWPSACCASTRVGSSRARAWPSVTCWPSRTRSSRRMPPSRLAMICSRPSGTTRPLALVTMSTCATAAQHTATSKASSIR